MTVQTPAPVATDCAARGRGSRAADHHGRRPCRPPSTLMRNWIQYPRGLQAHSRCVCAWALSQQTISSSDKSLVGACVLLALCHRCCLDPSHHALRPCHAAAATVSATATTVKSHLAHSLPTQPPSSLPLAFPLGLRYRDIAIRIATIIDMDFWPRYNP